jgi:hypothetical protein
VHRRGPGGLRVRSLRSGGSRPRGRALGAVNRFSTGLDRQQHALVEAGCLRVFAGRLSGKNADRPEPAACLDYLRPSLDRLSRSLADLIQIVGTLRRPDNTVSYIAQLLGVSRATIYKYVPEVTTGRAAVALPPGQG